MDFGVVMTVYDKQTRAQLEQKAVIIACDDCKTVDEFEREYVQDVAEFMQGHILAGDYAESKVRIVMNIGLAPALDNAHAGGKENAAERR